MRNFDNLGKGNIRLQIARVTHVITNIFYIPELKNNLLSIRQLQERGVSILIEYEEYKISPVKKGLIMQNYAKNNVCKQDVHITYKNHVSNRYLLPIYYRRQHLSLTSQIWTSRFQRFEKIET